MKVFFFGQLKEVLSTPMLDIDEQVATVAELKSYLAKRGELWHQYLLDSSCLSAVNHVIVNDSTVINDSDEIAFFPPVTGG